MYKVRGQSRTLVLRHPGDWLGELLSASVDSREGAGATDRHRTTTWMLASVGSLLLGLESDGSLDRCAPPAGWRGGEISDDEAVDELSELDEAR